MGREIAAAPVLLTIAGFDPSCGAGVGADLKTFAAARLLWDGRDHFVDGAKHARRGKRCNNTPSAELREQLDVLAKDSEIAAVKVGMLGNRGERRGSGGISGCAQVRSRGA